MVAGFSVIAIFVNWELHQLQIMSHNLPVIFLAFANDKQSEQRYLRSLTYEKNEVSKALNPVHGKLCRVIIETDVSIETIINTFQQYRDQIAIFHYGGHADDLQLLLETETGAPVPAYRSGLISFLANQRGLSLVFFNGCSTYRFARDLTDSGVPVVIGTNQAIPDDAAARLASRFYWGVSHGASIGRAWREAIDQLKIRRGENHRGVKLETETDRPPWDIYYAKGAEMTANWNLPEASRNPLFGLDLYPEYYDDLPECPFRELHRYEKRHAAIFFGRGAEIRVLYDKLMDRRPVLLYHGKSGVGKSSLLEAGLLPRIKKDYLVLYCRRDPETGLRYELETAIQAELNSQAEMEESFGNLHREIEQKKEDIGKLKSLEASTKIQQFIDQLQEEIVQLEHRLSKPSLLDIWKQVEDRGKPLLVILDQVEEVFTKPMEGGNPEDELSEFCHQLQSVFGKPSKRPAGKLILAFRSEWKAEIEKQLNLADYHLPYTDVFLAPLDRRGICTVVSGLSRSPLLSEQYSVEVEVGFPEFVADDILREKKKRERYSNLIAPVLQILLFRMWSASKEDNPRVFGRELFDRVDGFLWIEGFLNDKLAELEKEQGNFSGEVLVRSGLVLEILYLFTTRIGTADFNSYEKLISKFPHLEPILIPLLNYLVMLGMIAEVDPRNKTYRLIHDSLGDAVKERHAASTRLIQVMARLYGNGDDRPLHKDELLRLVPFEPYFSLLAPLQRAMIDRSWKIHISSIVKEQIAGNRLDRAFEMLHSFLEDYEQSDLKVTLNFYQSFPGNYEQPDQKLPIALVFLKTAYDKFKEEHLIGVANISSDESVRRKNEIIQGLLELVEKINLLERRKVGQKALDLFMKGKLIESVQLINDHFEYQGDNELEKISNVVSERLQEQLRNEITGIVYFAESRKALHRARYGLLYLIHDLISEKKEYFDVDHFQSEDLIKVLKSAEVFLLKGDILAAYELLARGITFEKNMSREILLLLVGFKYFDWQAKIWAMDDAHVVMEAFFYGAQVKELQRELAFFLKLGDQITTSPGIPENALHLIKQCIWMDRLEMALELIDSWINKRSSFEYEYVVNTIRQRLNVINHPLKAVIWSREEDIERNKIRMQLIDLIQEIDQKFPEKFWPAETATTALAKGARSIDALICIDRLDLALEQLSQICLNSCNDWAYELLQLAGWFHRSKRLERIGLVDRWENRYTYLQIGNPIRLILLEECDLGYPAIITYLSFQPDPAIEAVFHHSFTELKLENLIPIWKSDSLSPHYAVEWQAFIPAWKYLSQNEKVWKNVKDLFKLKYNWLLSTYRVNWPQKLVDYGIQPTGEVQPDLLKKFIAECGSQAMIVYVIGLYLSGELEDGFEGLRSLLQNIFLVRKYSFFNITAYENVEEKRIWAEIDRLMKDIFEEKEA